MRISTKTIFETGSAKMSELQASLVKTQSQISSGKRILSPSDDPVGAARALDVSQAMAQNDQYAINRQNIRDSLAQEDSTLGSVSQLLQDFKSLVVRAGNGVLDDTQRGFIATEMQGKMDDLLAYANAQDSSGNYIFAGYKSNAAPFAKSGLGATYYGDQGTRDLDVGMSRTLAQGDPGSAVFEGMRTGNGYFVTSPATAVSGGVVTQTNAGTGVISQGTVVDFSALTGHDYVVTFGSAGNSYTVTDNTLVPPATVTTGTYTPGAAISFDGLQFSIEGAPAGGDTFTVQPSRGQSVFTAMKNVIDALKMPNNTPTLKAAMQNSLNTANQNVDNALDNVLTVRASVGARLKELDSLDSLGDDRKIQFSQTLSQLQDVDYNQAITELMQQQTTLSAAQQSYIKITGLNLFKYL